MESTACKAAQEMEFVSMAFSRMDRIRAPVARSGRERLTALFGFLKPPTQDSFSDSRKACAGVSVTPLVGMPAPNAAQVCVVELEEDADEVGRQTKFSNVLLEVHRFAVGVWIPRGFA